MEKRTDASGWLYERAELAGQTVWGTGAPIDHDTVPQGLYCYDLFGSGEPMDTQNNHISRNPVAENCVGALISTEPVPFQGRESLCLEGMEFMEDEPLCSLDEIAGQAQQMGGPQEMAGLRM